VPDQLVGGIFSTITRAVDVLRWLSRDHAGKEKSRAPFSAAVIDESQPSGRCISDALSKAGFKPTVFDNPAQGLEHLKSRPMDLVIANLFLPELHGLQLADIKQLPLHAETPVIFVSESTALDHSKAGLLAGAPSVNNNPLLLMELVMKALNEVQSKGMPTESPTLDTPTATPRAETVEPDSEMSAVDDGGSELISPPTLQVNDPLVPAPPDPTISAEPFLLPSSEQATNRVAEKAGASSQEKKTILFVEDDPFALKVYKKGLKRAGFRVEVAEDGLAAINELPVLRPDVVVLDLMLPELPGTEVLRFIRADEDLKDIPVIVLSNAYMDELAAEAIRAGATRGLLKSECTPAKLVEQVCDVLGRPGATIPLESILQEPEPVMSSGDVDLAAETAIWTRQAGLRKAAPKEVAKIRQVCLNYIKSADDEKSMPQLMDLYRRVRFLSAHAALIGFTKIAEVSSALEGLLFEIVCKQAEPTSTTFQTLAQVVDLLDHLVQKDDTTFSEPRTKPKVLVVEDDQVEEAALATALKRGNFEVQCSQDPVQSLELLNADNFDLVLLEIDMPQMSGFEVCKQLRQMPQHKSVPVLFATVNAGFEHRARSVISGGNDMIAKPVSPLELILKVTTHLLKQNGNKLPDRSNGHSAANSEEATIEPSVTESAAISGSDREATPGIEPTASLAASSTDPMARGITPAIPSSENSQTAEASEAAAEDRTEGQTLSAGAAAERQTDEDKVQKPLIRMIDSEGPDGLASEPIAKARTGESEWTVASTGVTAEPASPQQDDAKHGAEDQKSVPAPESSTAATEAGGPLSPLQALQAECAKLRETVARHETDREKLADRIFNSENNLHRAQSRLQRREKLVEDLQKQLNELKAQQPSAETTQRLEELENALAQRAAELERAKGDLEQQTKERERIEADLRQQLAAAGETGKQSAAAHEQAQSRVAQLEQELVALRQAGEELNSKIVSEQQVGAESTKRIKELEENLGQRATELENARGAQGKEAKEHEFIETDLREQLAAASEAAKQSAAAHEHAQSRVSQLGQELVALRQTGEELNCKVAKEQQAGAESSKRIKELEENLSQRATELENARGAQEKEAKEHEFIETDLREQLTAASEAGKQSAAAHEHAQSRVSQLEQELVALRQTSEELNSKVASEQQAGAESGKRITELEESLRQRAAELENARGAQEKEAKEHEFVETDLRQQLAATSEADKQNAAAHEQARSRVAQLEQELVALRQAGEELNCKVAKEQQAGAQSGKRIQELEETLRQGATELENARGALEKEAKEHEFVETDLRQQLAAAGEAGKQSATAQEQAQSRVAQLKQELVALRQAGEELNSKVAKEQQAGAQSGKRIHELEETLRQRATELESARGDLDQQKKERESVETHLRRQLAAASEAGSQSATAHQQAQSRVAQLEQELVALRQVGEELNCKVAQEQQAGAESSKRVSELGAQLRQHAAELERARLDLEKQIKSRNRLEADLRRKLKIASDAGKEREAAVQQTQSRVSHLEQELVALRQTGEELNCKVAKEQQAGAQSGKRIAELEDQLRQRSAELEHVKGNLEQRAKAHGLVEADLRRQLQVASEVRQQSETAHQSRVAQFQQELVALRQAGEELNRKVATEQHAGTEASKRVKELEENLRGRAVELERARGDLEQQARTHGQVETDLRQQLAAAAEAGKQSSAAHQQAQSRVAELEQEMVALRQAGEELNCKVVREQQAGAESSNRISKLEEQLRHRAAELEHAKGNLQLQAAEHERVGVDLRQQLAVAGEAAQRSAAAQQQAQSRAEQLEQNLAVLRQAGQEFNVKLVKEQQAAAELRALNKDLERQLESSATVAHAQTTELEQRISQGVAALARVTADLAKATGERQRSDERAAALNLRLQELHAESGRLLQAQHADRERINDLDAQLHQRNETVARQVSDLEQLQAECRLTEDQLLKARDLNAHLRKNLSFLEEAHQTLNTTHQDLQSRFEAALDTAQATGSSLQREASERQQLATNLDHAQRELQAQGRMREALEIQLQKTLQALSEGETKLQQEMAERQRLALALDAATRDLRNQTQKRDVLEVDLQNTVQALRETESRATQETAERYRLNQALDAAQLSLRDQSQRAALELTKLQSALQFEHVERKRREAQMARMRHLSLDSARGARSLRNTLRRQTREPLDSLYQSARTLLQLELGHEQMKLAEAILQDVLLVHARLQEMETPHHDSAEAEANGDNGASDEVPVASDAGMEQQAGAADTTGLPKK
jgi:DNA-binding response OmpR family regulator/chromosome segregation ATPase